MVFQLTNHNQKKTENQKNQKKPFQSKNGHLPFSGPNATHAFFRFSQVFPFFPRKRGKTPRLPLRCQAPMRFTGNYLIS